MSNNHYTNYNKKNPNKVNRRDYNAVNVENLAKPVSNPTATVNQETAYEPKVEEKVDTSFPVMVDIDYLNIRKGPGMDCERTGIYTGKGTFIITEVKNGTGSTAGWGRLKSGAGWISLDYATRV